MTISLALLAPNLVKAAVEGRLPRGIGVERLRDPPTEWSRQLRRSDLIQNKCPAPFWTGGGSSDEPSSFEYRTLSNHRPSFSAEGTGTPLRDEKSVEAVAKGSKSQAARLTFGVRFVVRRGTCLEAI